MNKRQKIIGFILATSIVALTGCKTLQETAQSKKFTQPEGVTLLTESELRDTLVGNTYTGGFNQKTGQ